MSIFNLLRQNIKKEKTAIEFMEKGSITTSVTENKTYNTNELY